MIRNRPPSLMPTYAPFDVAFERGEGSYLFDANGKKYLDFASGIAVPGLGHAHPHLVEALCEQAGRLWHTSNCELSRRARPESAVAPPTG